MSFVLKVFFKKGLIHFYDHVSHSAGTGKMKYGSSIIVSFSSFFQNFPISLFYEVIVMTMLGGLLSRSRFRKFGQGPVLKGDGVFPHLHHPRKLVGRAEC